MNKTGLILSAFLIMLLAVIMFSCEGKDDADKFLIKVDSIQAPAEATMNIPFTIAFFGTIGSNGCYSFSNVVMNHSGHNIEIETWGKIDKSKGDCPDVMVYLTGLTVNCTIDYPGIFKIRIRQPDGSFIEKEVTVYYDFSDL
jgi:hypothetical protein